MKRMKFTLGIALSALFLGVSLNSVAADYVSDIRMDFVIYPSPYYAQYYDYNSNPADRIIDSAYVAGLNWGFQIEGYAYGPESGNLYVPPYWWEQPQASTASGRWLDIRYDKYDTREISGAGYTFSKATIGTVLGKPQIYNSPHEEWARYIQDVYVYLKFKDGNDKMPFVKRTIHYTDGKSTDLYFEDNLMIPSEPEYWIFGTYDYRVDPYGWPLFYHNPANITDMWSFFGYNPRPYFTDGDGIALYVFSSDISALMEKYIITDILYEVSIGDVISYVNGDGQSGQSGYGSTTISRSVTFDYNDSGLSVYPLFYSGMQYWVPSHTDLEFAVKGNEEIVVTIDPAVGAYGPNKAYVKKDAGSEGVWNVSIPQITQNMTVKIGYASNTEGATGNALAPVTDFAYASSGLLHVSASAPSTLSIYNITGQLVKQTKVTGNLTMGLKKGLYIVKLNGKAYKVLL